LKLIGAHQLVFYNLIVLGASVRTIKKSIEASLFLVMRLV